MNRIHKSCSGILTLLTAVAFIMLLAGCGAEQLASNFSGAGAPPTTLSTTGSGTGSGGGTTGGGSGTTGSGTGSTPTPSSTNGIPHSSHVVLVIEENHMFNEIYPNGMPWLVAQGNKYGYTLNYHADEPGSMLDY